MRKVLTEWNLLAPLAVIVSVVSLCVGSSYAKSLFAELGAQGASAYRVGLAALILLIVWRPWRIPLSRENAQRIWLYGAILGLMNLCFYMALRTLPIGIAIAIEFTGPLALAMILSRRLVDFLWIAFAIVGLLLLSPLAHDVKTLDPTGLCFVLAAAVLWALYIVIGKRCGSVHVGQVTSLGLVVASFIVVPIGIAHAGTAFLSLPLFAVGLTVAVLSSAIPYTLEMFALKRLPKETFGILLSTEPAVGAVSGWLILGESLTVLEMTAIACIMLASIGSTSTMRREEEPSPADPVAP